MFFQKVDFQTGTEQTDTTVSPVLGIVEVSAREAVAKQKGSSSWPRKIKFLLSAFY